MNCRVVLMYVGWKRLLSTHCVHVSDYVFVDHCASSSLVYHLEKPEILHHGTDLRRRPISVLNHPLEECLEMCSFHVCKCFIGIAKSRVKAKTVYDDRSAGELIYLKE